MDFKPSPDAPPTQSGQTGLKLARRVAYSAFVSVLILPAAVFRIVLRSEPGPQIDELFVYETAALIFLGLIGYLYGVVGGIYAVSRLAGSRSRSIWFAAAAILIPILSIIGVIGFVVDIILSDPFR
jgi:hypothetical protein